MGIKVDRAAIGKLVKYARKQTGANCMDLLARLDKRVGMHTPGKKNRKRRWFHFAKIFVCSCKTFRSSWYLMLLPLFLPVFECFTFRTQYACCFMLVWHELFYFYVYFLFFLERRIWEYPIFLISTKRTALGENSHSWTRRNCIPYSIPPMDPPFHFYRTQFFIDPLPPPFLSGKFAGRSAKKHLLAAIKLSVRNRKMWLNKTQQNPLIVGTGNHASFLPRFNAII